MSVVDLGSLKTWKAEAPAKLCKHMYDGEFAGPSMRFVDTAVAALFGGSTCSDAFRVAWDATLDKYPDWIDDLELYWRDGDPGEGLRRPVIPAAAVYALSRYAIHKYRRAVSVRKAPGWRKLLRDVDQDKAIASYYVASALAIGKYDPRPGVSGGIPAHATVRRMFMQRGPYQIPIGDLCSAVASRNWARVADFHERWEAFIQSRSSTASLRGRLGPKARELCKVYEVVAGRALPEDLYLKPNTARWHKAFTRTEGDVAAELMKRALGIMQNDTEMARLALAFVVCGGYGQEIQSVEAIGATYRMQASELTRVERDAWRDRLQRSLYSLDDTGRRKKRPAGNRDTAPSAPTRAASCRLVRKKPGPKPRLQRT